MGFTNHTDRAGLQRAHTAGFDQVIVKSALVERAPELVAELTRVDRSLDVDAAAAKRPPSGIRATGTALAVPACAEQRLDSTS